MRIDKDFQLERDEIVLFEHALKNSQQMAHFDRLVGEYEREHKEWQEEQKVRAREIRKLDQKQSIKLTAILAERRKLKQRMGRLQAEVWRKARSRSRLFSKRKQLIRKIKTLVAMQIATRRRNDAYHLLTNRANAHLTKTIEQATVQGQPHWNLPSPDTNPARTPQILPPVTGPGDGAGHAEPVGDPVS